jgi:hypothetical protein
VGLTGSEHRLQRFTHAWHTGCQRRPLILTRSVSEASGAILEGGDISVAGPPAVAKDGDATAGAELTWDGVALESASFGMPGDRFGRIGLRQALEEADAVAVGVETIEVVEDHGSVAKFP